MSALTLLIAPSADAAFTGSNGKIVFERTTGFVASPQRQIHVVNPDGTGQVQITTISPSHDPAWSPDGTRIAFVRGSTVMTMDPNGGGVQTVLPWPDAAGQLDWSPDGERLAVELRVCDAEGDCRFDIHAVNVDGTGLTDVTPDPIEDRNPSWSPDGTRIAFNSSKDGGGQDIYTVQADGGGLTQVTTDPSEHVEPDWSPDGEQFLFRTGANAIRYMDADGTNMHNVHEEGDDPAWSPDQRYIVWSKAETASQQASCPDYSLWTKGLYHLQTEHITGPNAGQCVNDITPDWQPLPPINAYPRPKGASPMDVPLVPAYNRCRGGPFSTTIHGPPLDYASCPPTRTSTTLTLGTADSNGAPTKSVSRVSIGVLVGNPSTPADEADLRLFGTVNDVRLGSDLSDYTGELEASMSLRITDKNNTPNYGGGTGAATASFEYADYMQSNFPITYSFPIPCVATADTTVGGDCSFDTTAEALVPGIVTELKRAVWQLGQIVVRDENGNDFLRQGIFVP
jgi:hypothetical protein